MQEKESSGIDYALPIETKLADLLVIYQKVLHLSPQGISPAIIAGELSPL